MKEVVVTTQKTPCFHLTMIIVALEKVNQVGKIRVEINPQDHLVISPRDLLRCQNDLSANLKMVQVALAQDIM